MLGQTYDSRLCSIARTLEVVGERWSLLIIRDALLGLRRCFMKHMTSPVRSPMPRSKVDSRPTVVRVRQ